MGQKTSPIATRLYGNCWPNSCWYSDENIFSLFYQDFNQKQFFDAVMPPSGRKFGFRPATIVCHQFPKKSSIHVFFLRRNRRFKLRGNQRRRVFRFAKNKSRFQSKGLRMPVNKRLSAIDVAAIQHLYANKNMLKGAKRWNERSVGGVAPTERTKFPPTKWGTPSFLQRPQVSSNEMGGFLRTPPRLSPPLASPTLFNVLSNRRLNDPKNNSNKKKEATQRAFLRAGGTQWEERSFPQRSGWGGVAPPPERSFFQRSGGR